MPVETVVLNASPLILLCNTALSFVLPALFSDIVVPEAVWHEIINGSRLDKAARLLPTLDWLQKVQTSLVPDVVHWDLGMGETAV